MQNTEKNTKATADKNAAKALLLTEGEPMRIVCGCCLVQCVYNLVSSILRAIGDSRTPLYFLIVCSLSNIVLDLIAVLALHWDVAGVAIATILAQLMSSAICLMYMFRKYPQLKFSGEHLRNMGEELKELGNVGGQMVAQNVLLCVGLILPMIYYHSGKWER